MGARIVYMGTPEFAVAPLAKLAKSEHRIVGVVTVPDKPSGRGLKLNESDVKKFHSSTLADKGIPLFQPTSLKDPQFISDLEALNADIFIVVAFRMLPKIVWDMPKYGTFNLHGSLLPAYRGAAPINWAIINGEKSSGVTTFLIDEQIDTGNILLQESILLDSRETVGTLYHKLMGIGADLVTETVNKLLSGITPKPQQGEVKEAPKLNKEICRIKWDSKVNNEDNCATSIDRFVRGLSPYPCATSTITNGEKSIDFKIFHTLPLDDYATNKDCGTIISDNKTFIHFVCADGSLLAIEELQIAGKKRMSSKEFLMGFRNITDYRVI